MMKSPSNETDSYFFYKNRDTATAMFMLNNRQFKIPLTFIRAK